MIVRLYRHATRSSRSTSVEVFAKNSKYIMAAAIFRAGARTVVGSGRDTSPYSNREVVAN